MRSRFLYLLLLLCFLFPSVSGCAAKEDTPDTSASDNASAYSPRWQSLVDRLKADGLYGPDVAEQLALFGEPTQDPMGYKISELYRYAFRKTPPPSELDKKTPPKPKARVYAGVPTQANAQLCRDFIAENKATFDLMEKRYGVPQHIAVGLLFVETRLGKQLGKSQAYYSLASMASSTKPEHIASWLPKLEKSEERLDWINERMIARSDWAYKEFKALLKHARANKLDPQNMPGSIYGAIGLCQFMPSNLDKMGIDGDGDGMVNLFHLPDALSSLSNYLVMNGWKPGMSRADQHKTLRTYNHIDIYANTILALSDLVQGKEQGQLYATVNKKSTPVSPEKAVVKANAKAATKNAKPAVKK